ncbi:hypothetical protein GCM10020000_51980 [Streptomyces olivoverticillatus]
MRGRFPDPAPSRNRGFAPDPGVAAAGGPVVPTRSAPAERLPTTGRVRGKDNAPMNVPYTVDITPRTAGWAYTSLRILTLPPGRGHAFDARDSEWIVLPLSGSCTVETDGQTFELRGRDSVFTAVTDFAYVPP